MCIYSFLFPIHILWLISNNNNIVEEIESLDRSIHWLEIDLKPDQKWEVPEDRVRAQGLLSLSSRKVGNLMKALIDWDGQTGDEAERCTSGVATKKGALREWPRKGRDPLYRLGPCKRLITRKLLQ